MNKPVFTQSGEPDLRYRATREYLARKKVNTIMGVIVAWFLFVFFLVGVIGKIMQRPVSGRESAVKTTEVQAVETTPTPTPILLWNDAIRAVFPSDEAGRMIRICLNENRASNKYAINWNKNGTFDYSYCQINSVHKPKGMSDFDWKQYLEDPVNHAKEVRRIFLSQGWGAWTVARWTK